MRQFLSSEIAAKENKWQCGNATRWRNEAYDNLFHTAERELDPVKRAALFIAMNGCAVKAQGCATAPATELRAAEPAAVSTDGL
jgi:ABC-type transport system substrate-binding protein